MAADSIRLKLKLKIDTKDKRVLFAEANKEFVDFLFHILRLPVATVISLLRGGGGEGMVGSIANIYESIEKLEECCIQPNKTKDTLLKPTKVVKNNNNNSSSVLDRLLLPDHQKVGKVNSDERGFVKWDVTYMVMDDLVVEPIMCRMSLFCMMYNKFTVRKIGACEDRVVNLGKDEFLKLLKASLQSKTVLTDVFLKSEGMTATSGGKIVSNPWFRPTATSFELGRFLEFASLGWAGLFLIVFYWIGFTLVPSWFQLGSNLIFNKICNKF